MAAMLVRDQVDGQRTLFPLDESMVQISVGRSHERDLVIADDPHVSRLHCRLEAVGFDWLLENMSQKNPTLVNGDPLTARRLLRDQDEILIGKTKLVFRDLAFRVDPEEETVGLKPAPEITAAERKVLIALCRPFRTPKAFRAPATTKQIADELFVGEAAVNFHLRNLYVKYGICESAGESRRLLLANEALQRGPITFRDLLEPPDPVGADG